MNVKKLEGGSSSELEDECDSEEGGKGGMERDMRIEDILNPSDTPGLRKNIANFDIPLRRQKNSENHDSIEIVISALVNGCVLGKLVLANSLEKRKWMYSTTALQDSFIVSIGKEDIFRAIEKNKKRIMDKQVDFLRDIPQPDFSVLSKKKLSVICENLQIIDCTRGMVVFN